LKFRVRIMAFRLSGYDERTTTVVSLPVNNIGCKTAKLLLTIIGDREK